MMEKPTDPYEGLDDEARARAEAEMAESPEPEISAENKRDYKEMLNLLDDALTELERTFKFQELLAITTLTPEDAAKHKVRERERKALAPITEALRVLKDDTNCPDDVYEALRVRYKKLSQAVGIINNGVVDHTR